MNALEPLIVFVHVQKTAGKSLREVFYRQYGRAHTRLVENYFTDADESFSIVSKFAASPDPRIRVLHGHMLFWPDLPWPADTRFVTMLRDPVERTISHYYWLRAKNTSGKYTKTLEQAITDGSIHDNLQTRVISGEVPPFGEVDEGMLERAIARLDRFTVGLTDRFDESVALFAQTLGWRMMLCQRANVTPKRKDRSEIEPHLIETIERNNLHDAKLYRYAQDRFEAQLAAQNDDFHLELAAVKLASKRAAGNPLDDAPSSDLRERLIDAKATVLLNELEIHRLRKAAKQRQEDSPPTPVSPDEQVAAAPVTAKRGPTIDERAARVAEGLDTARTRLAELRAELEARQATAPSADDPTLTALRQRATELEERIAGYEERSENIRRRREKAAARESLR